MSSEIDIVTVFHNEKNRAQYEDLSHDIALHLSLPYTLIGVDNRLENRGFGPGCNYGAAQGTSPIIGFLNPDTWVLGDFGPAVAATLQLVQVTGERFAKSQRELRIWGVRDWVCGAAFFTRRDWWESLGGFDERFWMYFEETDFIRRTEAAGGAVRSIELPLHHESPTDDSPGDMRVKQRAFQVSGMVYQLKWNEPLATATRGG